MTSKKYRRKPVEVEAIQFVGGSLSAATVVRWILDNGGWAHYETVDMDTIQGMIGIKTPKGQMHATPGDFIVRDARGQFYPYKPEDFVQNYDRAGSYSVVLSEKNRRIIEQAYDAGDGVKVALISSEDGWFSGEYEDFEVFQALEHEGTLYTIVHASGGGLVSVLVGSSLVENETGLTFHSIPEAKAYVQGLIAK